MPGGFLELVLIGIFGTLSAYADVLLQGETDKAEQARRKADYEAYKKSPNYGKTFLEIQRGW